jgi:hypothetical protein
MLKKHELAQPNSCLNKAGPNERIFVLRENDPLFAQAVRHWATMADGVHEVAKVKEARELADAAEKARAARDVPAEVAAPVPSPCEHCRATHGSPHAKWCRHHPDAMPAGPIPMHDHSAASRVPSWASDDATAAPRK